MGISRSNLDFCFPFHPGQNGLKPEFQSGHYSAKHATASIFTTIDTHGAEKVQIATQDAAGTIHIQNNLYNQVPVVKDFFFS